MRYVCNYTWRVFYSCFIQGAWRCLNQDMDFERHATLLFSAPRVPTCKETARKRKRGVPFKIHVLVEARPSALNKTRIEDTPRVITHVAHLTYPALFIEDLVVFH